MKSMYLSALGSEAGSGISVENLRFFCMGKELKNDMYLYSYDIQDEMTIQAMIKK